MPADPTGFIVPSDDVATQLVQRFLQAALYRLDPRLVPQPDLAAAAPVVAANGLTWRVTLAAGRHFSDGTPVAAADVVRTYQLALQPDCPFGDLCDTISGALAGVASPAAGVVVFTLRRPWAPFETDVMAQLPILPAAALDASLARLRGRDRRRDDPAGERPAGGHPDHHDRAGLRRDAAARRLRPRLLRRQPQGAC